MPKTSTIALEGDHEEKQDGAKHTYQPFLQIPLSSI